MDDIKYTAEVVLSIYRNSLLIGVFILLFFYKRVGPFYKWLIVYLFLMAFIEALGYLLGYVLKNGNNHIIVPLTGITELIFFLLLYRLFFIKKDKVISALGIICLVFSLSEILWYFVFNDISSKSFQSYTKVVTNFFIIILTLTFLYREMANYKSIQWNQFWFNIVLLFFYTFNTIIFLPFNFLVNADLQVKFYFWIANVASLLLFYGYLAIKVVSNAIKMSN